ncbi:Outer membrane protein TolC [bacterium A37T11]|nr:Outer membrane protein TolC [bacterium A37T11]
MPVPKRNCLFLLIIISGTFQTKLLAQQPLTLKAAIDSAMQNYGSIRAKDAYAKAANEGVTQAKREYLPNLNLSAQQDYGTVNGQNGPIYGFGGLGVGSSGPSLPEQNWNAAFGALYLTNLNWEFFAFGKYENRVKSAKAAAIRDQDDLEQERFKQRVKVSAAYLNLLAAQRLTLSYQKNFDRANTLRKVVVTRAINGLIAGVDSSQANAEVSSARTAWIKAKDTEQEQANRLAILMGVNSSDFVLDSMFISRVPAALTSPQAPINLDLHPELQWYKSRIAVSEQQTHYLSSLKYPAFSLVGVFQTRGSGFDSGYTMDQQAFTHSYTDGVKPTRSNYLFGIGLTWNITQALRISPQVRQQRFISTGLQAEYEQANQELSAQLQLADQKIRNALDNYNEVPIQVKAASDAYLQKSVLYKNGLTNLVDVTQTLYALIRAETDRDIAYNNVWQALLLKAAASGDFGLFINEL